MDGSVWHAIANYRRDGNALVALVLDGALYDLELTARAFAVPDSWCAVDRIETLLEEWPSVAPRLAALAARAEKDTRNLEPLEVGPHDLAAPVRAGRIFCAAANYLEHAEEMGTALAGKANSRPYMFMKPDTSIIGHNAAINIPKASSQVDWEIELGVVIGRAARRVSAARALDYVAGYTVLNDISARDLNVRDDYPFKVDWLRGKCFDTFAPLGPWLVPASCIDDPQALRMTLSVNGNVMQDAKTSAMIFDVREQIEYLSSILTLKPADVIATGTPTGVGMARGIFLKAGDVIEASIEGIGELRNPVVEEIEA
jgi:2-keto-4-pentenoate hydratase/2-oxohepta-3-ene-1,7-dioic acid hydratase in catechol pathway